MRVWHRVPAWPRTWWLDRSGAHVENKRVRGTTKHWTGPGPVFGHGKGAVSSAATRRCPRARRGVLGRAGSGGVSFVVSSAARCGAMRCMSKLPTSSQWASQNHKSHNLSQSQLTCRPARAEWLCCFLGPSAAWPPVFPPELFPPEDFPFPPAISAMWIRMRVGAWRAVMDG